MGRSRTLLGVLTSTFVHQSFPLEFQGGVDEADQGGLGVFAAEDALEGEVGFGVKKSHGTTIAQGVIKVSRRVNCRPAIEMNKTISYILVTNLARFS